MNSTTSRLSIACTLALVSACRRAPPQEQSVEPPAAAVTAQPPAATATGPSITQLLRPLPEVEPLDANKVTLGRRLFHDTRLSGDNTLSCASCHSLDRGGADGAPVSTGIRGQHGTINSPTVLNARFNFVQFWDGRAATLAAQAAGPVANPVEMGHSWDAVVTTLRAEPTYAQAFAQSYPDGVTAANVQDAIATYEMTLVTPSRVDRFLRGDVSALTAEERAGADLFASVGCTMCHLGVNVGGSMYQKMGLVRDYFAERGSPITSADSGRFEVTHQESDRHFFKVPTLRNVALTSPYFHDAHAATLEDAIRTMGRYQLGRELDGAQTASLATFLRALTGEIPPAARMPATTVSAR